MQINGKEILAVKVPEDVSNVVIFEDYNGVKKLADNWADEEFMPFYSLPEGQWSILGRAGEITEEQARGLVESKYHPIVKTQLLYRNYNRAYTAWESYTALESFQSWCKANGVADTDLILIKNS